MWMIYVVIVYFFFFKQKTAYEMRISDWSSDVCSSDLLVAGGSGCLVEAEAERQPGAMQQRRRQQEAEAISEAGSGDWHLGAVGMAMEHGEGADQRHGRDRRQRQAERQGAADHDDRERDARLRSEEHTSELQSLMRTPYAVF